MDNPRSPSYARIIFGTPRADLGTGAMEYELLKTHAMHVAEGLVSARRQYDYYVSGQAAGSQRFTPSGWRIASLPLEIKVTDTPAGWAVTHQNDQEIWLQPSGALYVMHFSCTAGIGGTSTVASAASELTPAIARRYDRVRSLKMQPNGTWTFEDLGFISPYPFQGLTRFLIAISQGNSNPSQALASMGHLSDLDRMAAAGIFPPPPDAVSHPSLLAPFEDLQRDAAALAGELLARRWPFDSYVSENTVALEGWRVNRREETCCLIREQDFRSTYYKQTDTEIWLLATGSLVVVEFSLDRAQTGGPVIRAARSALTIHAALRLDRNREFKETREQRGDTIKDWEWFQDSELQYSQPLTGIRLALAELRKGQRIPGGASQGKVG